MRGPQLLFSKAPWHAVDDQQRTRLASEINQLDSNRLLNTSVEDLCEYFDKKYRVDVPVLRVDDTVVDQRETQTEVNDYGRQIRVKGTEIEFSVPFDGDKDSFYIQPSTYTLNPPRGEVSDGAILVRIEGGKLVTEQVRNEFNRNISEIQSYLTYLRANAEVLNSSIQAVAREAIERRREKILADQRLVSSLGFKMKERAGAERTYVAPEVRRKIAPVLPAASTKTYTPEPTLPGADYEHILSVIQNMAHVMERSPSAFGTMDEESLRSHFLVQLNGHYEGQATGETFNYTGKTDIIIRSDGKNIFIAECKFWGGAKKLLETLDQLLSYSSWRDTKVAVIIFNRNKDFSNVLKVIRDIVKTHPNCKKELSVRSETSFTYLFSHRDDKNREMTLTVMAFDVPT